MQVQRTLADDEHCILRGINVRVHTFPTNSHAIEQFSRLPLGIEDGDPSGRLQSRGLGQDVNGEGVLLCFTVSEIDCGLHGILSQRQIHRQIQLQGNAPLIAGRHRDLQGFVHGSGRVERPHTVGRHLGAGVIDEDQLLLRSLAGEEVVILAGEGSGPASDVRQQGHVVAIQGLCDRRGLVVEGMICQQSTSLVFVNVSRTRAGSLQLLPGNLQLQIVAGACAR